MKKIAVTGGIASGKTTVCRLFQQRGATVVTADAIVHQILSLKTPVGQRALELLGESVLVGGELDRERIAALVFGDEEKLDRLEKLIHPEVYRVINEEARSCSSPFFVVEIPLLFETGGERFFDAVIAVQAPEEIRRDRFPKRDFTARQKRQISDEERAQRADFLIVNDGDRAHLEAQVNEIIERLREYERRDTNTPNHPPTSPRHPQR